MIGPMHNLQIVTLNPEEWPAYRALRLEALRGEPRAFGSVYAEQVDYPDSFWQGRLRAAQAGENNWLLFAKEDERLIGLMGAIREAGSDAVHIVSVYVSAEKRGQGAAAALMTAILDVTGRQPGVRKACLTVNALQARALALYRRFGFQIVGEEQSLMGDGNTYLEYSMERPFPANLP